MSYAASQPHTSSSAESTCGARIEPSRVLAEQTPASKLAAVEKNHDLTVRAVRAEVQVEMLTRQPTQPLSNARSRSDSPAGQYMNMYLDN